MFFLFLSKVQVQGLYLPPQSRCLCGVFDGVHAGYCFGLSHRSSNNLNYCIPYSHPYGGCYPVILIDSIIAHYRISTANAEAWRVMCSAVITHDNGKGRMRPNTSHGSPLLRVAGA